MKTCKYSNYRFYGFIFYDQNNNKTFIKPHKDIKEAVEKQGNEALDILNKL